jgi:hypothetical protein
MDFHGFPARMLENDILQVGYLTDAGPRLVHLAPKGGANLLAELPNLKNETPYGTYHFFGGHRLWHSPEGMPRSYIPDTVGLQVKETRNGVCLTQPIEAGTGLRKGMELQLKDNKLTIIHTLKNESLWSIECAPWAITQFKLGGLAFIPQQRVTPQPELLHDRIVTFWNYTRLHDSRLNLDDDFFFMRGDGKLPPCKIGTYNPHGWLAYLIGDVLIIKKFNSQSGKIFPDNGCNSEVYVCDQFIELETLGPITCIQPGQEVDHTEVWEVWTDIGAPMTYEGVRQLVTELGL